MRVAVVHDWLTVYAGAEKVLEQILKIWPEADLFGVVDFFPEKDRYALLNKRAKTTFIQQLPWAKKKYRGYLPLMPLAIEQLDLSKYDLIISSSHGVAKGVVSGPDQVHVSYVHSPIRYAWDLQHQYLEEAGLTKGLKSVLARAVLHYLRIWDQRTAHGVDAFVVNSHFIGRRVRKAYGRSAVVIYPPVDVERFQAQSEKEEFYITASRMVPYKKIPLIVQAFARMPDKRLVVIGDGPEFERVRRVASPNVTLLGYQSNEVMADYMQRAKAFVFAAEEDFGIAPVEAQACGTPVIAYGKGGVLETVIESNDPAVRTGIFFGEQTTEAIVDAVRRFEEAGPFESLVARRNAELFSSIRFREELGNYVQEVVLERRVKSISGVLRPSAVANGGF